MISTSPTLAAPHLSGCSAECPYPLHLTPQAVEYLRRAGVPESSIDAALADEPRSHRPPSSAPATLSAHHVAVFTRAGVPAAELESLGEPTTPGIPPNPPKGAGVGASKAPKSAQQWAAEEQARLVAWKARNPQKNAEYQRAYRARQREKLRLLGDTPDAS